MSKHDTAPEQAMASLFAGLSRLEQMALLGRLESTGAELYRVWAAQEQNLKAREALLKAATREERKRRTAAPDDHRKRELRKVSQTSTDPLRGARLRIPVHLLPGLCERRESNLPELRWRPRPRRPALMTPDVYGRSGRTKRAVARYLLVRACARHPGIAFSRARGSGVLSIERDRRNREPGAAP